MTANGARGPTEPGSAVRSRSRSRSGRTAATRAAILEAAWRLVDQRAAVGVVGAASLAAIAAEAGVSRAGLVHHVPTRRDLGLVMADRLVAASTGLSYEDVAEVLRDMAPERVLEAIRDVAQANWDALNEPDAGGFEARFLRVMSAAFNGGPEADELRRVVAERYWGRFLPDLMTAYEIGMQRAHLRLVEPFTLEEVARILEGLADALMRQSLLEPGAVREELYADAVAVVLSAITTPRSEVIAVEDLSAYFVQQAAAVPRMDLEGWMPFLRQVGPLFVDGVGGISFHALAAAGTAGRTATEIRQTFGTVQSVAACVFVRHMPRFERAVRGLDQDPDAALQQLLVEVARAAGEEPHLAQALLAERLRSRTAVGAEVGPNDIRMLVPVAPMVSAAMRLIGLPLRALVDLGSTVLNAVLAEASAYPSDPPETVVEHALRLIPR